MAPPIILRSDPAQDDNEWNFTLSPPKAKRQGFGIHIKFSPKNITLNMEQFPSNRIIHGDDPSKFILASFADFRFPDTSPSVARDYMIRFFKDGLTLNGTHFRFYGHSNSQLRSRSCYLREAKSDSELDQRISRLGQFDKILNVAKRAKRIGLLFSSAPIDWQLDPQYVKDIADIKAGDELFSDGCGLISKRLAMQLSRKKRIIFCGKNYVPRVYQIRYKGYKGVLMLHPDLDVQKEALVHFRASQRKFTATGDNTFSVVDYSVPYAYGRLNDDVVVLLASLGITTEKFLMKQKAYFDWIAAADSSWETAFDFLASLGRFETAEKVLLDGLDAPNIKSEIQKLQNSELASFRKKSDETQYRTRMLIHKSRLLFGICDPYQVLREGEVHVRISVPRKGETTLVQTDLLVVRNPCLHPGDCLKLRAVDHPRLSHLVDCIVFPTVGRRAAPSMSSGGDLDGDRFLVIFDPDLVPSKIAESYTYPSPKENLKAQVSRQDLAKHFASYNNSSLARVAKLHRQWVRCSPEGAMSSQCQELNALHSLSVDGGRIKIPDRLKNPPNPEAPYVLDILADAAKKFVDNHLQSRPYPALTQSGIDDAESVIVQLLSLEKFVGSEYELVMLVLAIARKHRINFGGYLNHIDFSALSAPQKHSLSIQFPEQAPYIWNSLLRSDIIRPNELGDQVIKGILPLQRLYSSRIQGGAAFFEYLRQATEEYVRKLIILKTDDRFSVGIFMRGRIPWNEDAEVHENILVCSFMPHTGSGQQSTYRQSTKGYKMQCNDNTMEIFNVHRADTFIFVTRPPEKSGADIVSSIALQKISKHVQRQCGRINRTPVTTIEIHVISNRDRVAHQIFDLRFEHVQTAEYMRRFEHRPTPYTLNNLTGFDWSECPDKQPVFSTDKETAKKYLLERSENDLDGFMRFALRYRAEEQLFWIFESFLDRESLDHSRLSLWISQHPSLGYVILKRYLTDDENKLPSTVEGLVPTILRGVIRSANNLGIAALAAIERLAAYVNDLDLRQYIDMLWLASCSIRSRKLVQEVLIVLHECRAHSGTAHEMLEYAHKHALAIAVDRAEEAADECPCDDAGKPTRQRTPPLKARLVSIKSDGEPTSQNVTSSDDFKSHVMAHVRIDAPGSVRIHSHVRLQASSLAEPIPVDREVLDAIVVQDSKGEIRLETMHPLPPEFERMDWNIYPAGSVATAKAMMDAVSRLAQEGTECCNFSQVIIRNPRNLQNGSSETGDSVREQDTDISGDIPTELNDSQRRAVNVADSGFSLIWGPPGTGKTTVIVQILLRFLRLSQNSALPKILMTASTHNAVDNVLERFINENRKHGLLRDDQILRVATDGSKVAKTLQAFSMDARVGGSIGDNHKLIKQAEKRLNEAVVVFTTCAGAGLGIMRKADFETVLIDEASQVTEACALIPLTKGCRRAVLVGDHVQLRPTVKPMGKALEYDISLLERLYNDSDSSEISRSMLEVQYRFREDIGRFPSQEFYHGRLHSGLHDNDHEVILRKSRFPWPEDDGRLIANIFVPCAAEEDYGRASKSNTGQVQLVKHIVSLLQTPKDKIMPMDGIPSIAVLTPYSRQASELRGTLPSETVTSTIDGFQGRESDIVIFSTVRCNAEGDIGFVEDARRLNVAWTRCKMALIIVGDQRTLGFNSSLWKKAITSCRHVQISRPE